MAVARNGCRNGRENVGVATGWAGAAVFGARKVAPIVAVIRLDRSTHPRKPPIQSESDRCPCSRG